MTGPTAPAVPFAVRVEDFLLPIPGDDPAGPSLRYEGTYDAVRETRRADDPGPPQGIWTRDLKRADWKATAALCASALRERSKDLQLCAWLMEAWLHLHGFAGAAAGLRVMHAVSESFWDGLHPRGEGDGGCEARALVVEWLDGAAAGALAGVPLTAPSVADPDVHTWAAREGALRLENLARRDPAAAESAERDGVVTLARFDRAVSLTPTAFYAGAADAALRQAEEAAGRLQALLDERCGAAAAGLLRTRGVLAALLGWTGQVLAARPAGPAAPAAEEEPMSGERDGAGLAGDGAAEGAAVAGGVTAVTGVRRPRSREEAFRSLLAASDYLAETEPHSPVPYLVRRALSWGGMPLPELMIEFRRSGYDLDALYNLLGFDAGER